MLTAYLAGVAVSTVVLYLAVPFVPADIFDGRKPLSLLAVPPVAAFAWPAIVSAFCCLALFMLSIMAVAVVIQLCKVIAPYGNAVSSSDRLVTPR